MQTQSKRKALIIFSHNTHSFIISEIKYAANAFEKVIVLSPNNTEIENEIQKYHNVYAKFFDNEKSIQNIVKGRKLAGKLFKSEIAEVIKKRKITIHYFKLLSLYMSHLTILDDELKSLLVEYQENEIAILSMWFAATAFALSVVKERHPGVYAVSLAHSFEIDDAKNSFVDFLFKKIIHERLDKIYFISKNVRDTYLNNHVHPNGWNDTNIDISYLGVLKKCEGKSKSSDGNPYFIVSCSHCVPVKRIELIAEALCKITSLSIKWTHIGEGPTLKLVREIKNIPSNIEISTVGKQTNEYVHNFLSESCVDAFINVSSSEGLPVTLMEAIAYGIPIIATDVGGTSELFSRDIGLLLPSDPTIDQVKDAIVTLLTKDTDSKQKIRHNAEKNYIEMFNSNTLRSSFYENLSED